MVKRTTAGDGSGTPRPSEARTFTTWGPGVRPSSTEGLEHEVHHGSSGPGSSLQLASRGPTPPVSWKVTTTRPPLGRIRGGSTWVSGKTVAEIATRALVTPVAGTRGTVKVHTRSRRGQSNAPRHPSNCVPGWSDRTRVTSLPTSLRRVHVLVQSKLPPGAESRPSRAWLGLVPMVISMGLNSVNRARTDRAVDGVSTALSPVPTEGPRPSATGDLAVAEPPGPCHSSGRAAARDESPRLAPWAPWPPTTEERWRTMSGVSGGWVRAVVAVLCVVLASMTVTVPARALERQESAPDPGAGEAGGPSGTVSCDLTVSTWAALAVTNVPVAAGAPLFTVCLAAGSTITPPDELKWVRRNAVIAGLGTGSSRARISGRITVTADDVTVRDLRVTHSSAPVRLWADRVSLLGSEVSAPDGTCVEVGYLDGYLDGLPLDTPGADYDGYHKVHDVVISGNIIGGCADDSDFLDGWTCSNSGFPGIYSQWVDGLIVTENVVTSTALRGIQLFPFNRNVTVENNLLRRNSIAMNIGTSEASYTQAANVLVAGNLFDHQWSAELVVDHPTMQSTCIPNARPFTDFLGSNSPPGVTIDDQATGYNPQTSVDTSVTVTGNCGTDVAQNAGNRFTWSGNQDLTAAFVSDTDHHQVNGSDCASYGPTRLRPTGNQAPVILGVDAVEHPDDGVGPGARTVDTRRVFVYVWARDEQSSSTLQVRFANEAGAYSAWRPLSANLPWTLSGGSGQSRTLAVQVRDSSGVVSDAVGRSIRLVPRHDLSGDGFNDLLVRRTSDQVMRLYRGTSGGSLTNPTSMTGSWANFDTVIVTPDFDGDGITDVIVRIKPGRADSGQLRLYPGNNAGGFGTTRQIGSGWSSYPTIVAPGDFDRDGANDLLAVDSTGRLWLYPGNGTGTFLPRRQIGTSTGFKAYTFYAPGDFDGDGDVDVILRRNADGVLLLGPGDGRGGFAGAFPQIGTDWTGHTVVGTGDMNQDSFADLVTRKPNGELWVYKGTGAGRFNGSYRIGTSLWTAFDPLA